MGQAKSKMNGGKQKGRKKQAKADVEIANHVCEDILLDLSLFLNRAELARCFSTVSRRFYALFEKRLYSKGQFVIHKLIIRQPTFIKQVQFWIGQTRGRDCSSSSRIFTQKDKREWQAVQFPDVAPPPNIAGFIEITVAPCQIDAHVLAFFRQISTRPILAIIFNNLHLLLRKNSVRKLALIFQLIPRCRTLCIRKYISRSSFRSLMAIPRVQHFNVLAIRQYRHSFCRPLFDWLHRPRECGERQRPRKLTILIDGKSGKGLIEPFPLVQWIQERFMQNANAVLSPHRNQPPRHHFFLRIFFHRNAHYYPIGAALREIVELHMESRDRKELLELDKMWHPKNPTTMMVIYMRMGPKYGKSKMAKRGEEKGFEEWQKLWYQEYFGDSDEEKT